MPKKDHSAQRYGALVSWAATPNRTARTAPARRNSPSSLTYWLDKLDPERFANATEAQRLAAADAARRAHFVDMARRSAAARRRGVIADAPDAA